jgi:hypothetical protein
MAPRIGWLVLTTVLFAGAASAQVTPAPDYTAPDDTPSVRVGGTLFGDYSYTLAPETIGADGHRYHANAFNISRAYLNVTGQLNHLLAFRITPDVVRETGDGSSLDGRMSVYLKYGYAQLNLDDWLWRGTYVRAGMIPTPYVEFEDSIYRYRFQGAVFADREGYLPSSDYGIAFRTQLPKGYGEVVGGLYNGEGFARFEANDQKAVQVRGTVRPFPNADAARGLRLTVFYDADHYTGDGERRRAIGLASFEHRFVNLGAEYLDAADRVSRSAARLDSDGYSFWITPRAPLGAVPVAPPAGVVRASLEGLFRFDRRRPNRANDSVEDRWIAGVAYWPSMRVASVSAAFLLDYELVRYRRFALPQPDEKRLALHMLVSF